MGAYVDKSQSVVVFPCYPVVVTTGPCAWSLDTFDGSYDTGCGEKFEFTGDGPKQNGFKCCPYCGRKLEVK